MLAGTLGGLLRDLVHLRAVLSVDRARRPVHRAAARQQAAQRRARRHHRRRGRRDPQPRDLVRAAHLVPRGAPVLGDLACRSTCRFWPASIPGRSAFRWPPWSRCSASRSAPSRPCWPVRRQGLLFILSEWSDEREDAHFLPRPPLLLVVLPFSSEAQDEPTRSGSIYQRPSRASSPRISLFGAPARARPARWTVVEDASGQSGRAIAQISTDRTDYRFPLAVYKPFSARNLAVTLRFKPVAGNVDQAGGIAVRLTTPDDYYVVRANALEDNVRFYRVVKGRREQLAGANTKVSAERMAHAGVCGPRATASPSRSTARSCSPPATRPLPRPARLRCGPRPTASPISTRSRSRHCPDAPSCNQDGDWK